MPVVDSTYRETPFLPDDPANMLRNGSFSPDIDVMIGATKDEGILFLIGTIRHFLNISQTFECSRFIGRKQLNLGSIQRNLQHDWN